MAQTFILHHKGKKYTFDHPPTRSEIEALDRNKGSKPSPPPPPSPDLDETNEPDGADESGTKRRKR
jgi:hypothetical protein